MASSSTPKNSRPGARRLRQATRLLAVATTQFIGVEPFSTLLHTRPGKWSGAYTKNGREAGHSCRRMVATTRPEVHVMGSSDTHGFARTYSAFREEVAVRTPPSVEPYINILNACAEASRWEEALEVLEDMRQRGVKPDGDCYASALKACRRGRRCDQSLLLLQSMRAENIVPAVDHYFCALRALAGNGKWEEARKLLRDMSEIYDTPPDLFSYNAVIQACDIGLQPDMAIEVLQEMTDKGVPPNSFSYTAAMRACDRVGDWKRAISLFEKMTQAGVEPNWHTYRCLIMCCRKGMQSQSSFDYLKAMRALGPEPPCLRAYATTIRTCTVNRDFNQALEAADMLLKDVEAGRRFGREVMEEGKPIELDDGIQDTISGSSEPNGVNGDLPPSIDHLKFTNDAEAWTHAMDSVLDACNWGKQSHTAESTLERLRSIGIRPTARMHLQLANALEAENRHDAVLISFGRAALDGVHRTPDAYEYAVRACRALRMPARARSLVAEMTSHGLTPLPTTYAAAIAACTEQGGGRGWRDALELIAESEAAGVEPTKQAYASAVYACATVGQWQKAIELIKKMRSQGLVPNSGMYTKVIAACAEAQRLPEALALLAEMKKKGVKRRTETFNAAIDACASTGEWRAALQLLEVMEKEGAVPDLVSFNSAISACGKGRAWEAALKLLEGVRRRGLKPCAITYSAAITACDRSKRWREALVLLEMMRKDELAPTVVTYTAAIHACGGLGLVGKAMRLLNEMRQAGLEPNRQTYAAAMYVCASAGRGSRGGQPQWRRALELLSEMEAAGVAPDRVVINTAMTACARAAKWEDVLRLLEKLRSGTKGLSPDLISYNTALNACSRAGMEAQFGAVQAEMLADGFKPDAVTYNVRIGAARRRGYFFDALHVFDEMKAAGVQANVATYAELLWALCSRPFPVRRGLAADKVKPGVPKLRESMRQWELAILLMDEMQGSGIPRNAQIYTAAMTACNMDFAYKALLRLEEDRIADAVLETKDIRTMVKWATDLQEDEDNRLYPL